MSGRITIDGLSTSLREYINNLGLTEEQVQQLITRFENEKIGDVSTLTTENKTVVAAINELFQSANNGKELIATAIGEPLNSSDTFSAMSNGINGLLSTFKTNMMNNGVSVAGSDKFKQLIDKIATLVDSEGKGIKFASGTCEINQTYNYGNVTFNFTESLSFIPTHFFARIPQINFAGSDYGGLPIRNVIITNFLDYDKSPQCSTVSSTYVAISNITNTSFTIRINAEYISDYVSSDGTDDHIIDWYAIGVGEEDTTLRDSLASILQDEGVVIVPEDNMASLITKTDEEFTKKNNKAENTRSTLAGLMKDGGYEITGDEDIDRLLELLTISGIALNEIKQIASGYDYIFILKNDGSLWSCGANDKGQLGLGDTNGRATFTQVTTNINNDVKEVICGFGHTFILKNNGSIWSCGHNNRGQLGIGTSNTDTHSTFTKVTTNINNDVKQIACGGYHTFILKNNGSLWACGENNYKQLGLGDNNNRTTFTKVTTNINNDVKQIACGYNHTFILKNDGTVWSCGYNQYGGLGLGDTNVDRTTFTKVTTNINNDVKEIVCGGYSTFILKNDSSLWACGHNNYGLLGTGNSGNYYTTFTKVTTNINNDVKEIVCGGYHTFILKTNGTVWSCGYNGYGQLGLGGNDINNRTTFTNVTANINNDVKEIVCGGYSTFILKNDGTVWSCGDNRNGQLGLGTSDDINHTLFTQIPKGLY